MYICIPYEGNSDTMGGVHTYETRNGTGEINRGTPVIWPLHFIDFATSSFMFLNSNACS